MDESRICHQVNLQRGFGGGEVYTSFFSQALLQLGWKVRLYVNASNPHWTKLLPPGCETIPLTDIDALLAVLPASPTRIFFHAPPPERIKAALRNRGYRLCVFAHMPLYGRNPEPLRNLDYVIAVSQHVIASLRAANIDAVHPVALLGVADLERTASASKEIFAGAVYDWDLHKVRDRLGYLCEPMVRPFLPRPRFERRPGITLGVVSRITPIKQFPLLFSYLAPLLAREPDVNLEIFGSGGYASVRDLRHALRPLRRRTRFWGHQENVRAVYSQLDALLTGLPEKEALGLNVIEAQACGLPVLAVNAPPFDETVADGITGWRYTDPRLDGGADFLRALAVLRLGLPDAPEAVQRHLFPFSFSAFVVRVAALMDATNHLQEGSR